MQEESRIDYLNNQIKNSRATWYYEGLPEQIECYLHKGDYGQYQRDYFIPNKSLRAKYKDCELFYDNESDPNCSNDMATIRVRDADLSKAYEIVKAFKEALDKSDRAEKIKTKEIDGALYIYIAPFDAYPEFRMVTPAYRKSAIEDITLSLDDFSRTFDTDLLNGLSDQEKADKIKEEIKKEFPKASKADINYVIDNIYEYLDEDYNKGDNKMYNTLEEAFKELNKKPARKVNEAKEKDVCPECGKEVCECNKKVNEDIQITSDEIKDFIAKVGADAIKKALDDFEGAEAEPDIEEPVEDVPVDDLAVAEPIEEPTEEADVAETEESAEDAEEKDTEEEVKENLNEENLNDETADVEYWANLGLKQAEEFQRIFITKYKNGLYKDNNVSFTYEAKVDVYEDGINTAYLKDTTLEGLVKQIKDIVNQHLTDKYNLVIDDSDVEYDNDKVAWPDTDETTEEDMGVVTIYWGNNDEEDLEDDEEDFDESLNEENTDEGILSAASSVVNGVVDGIKSIVDSKEPEEGKEEIEEDVASSLPATPLPEQAILDYVASVPKATSEIPPRYFKLGYMSEETYKLAARFRGGRGSVNKETGELLPSVRVFKCAEYSRVYVEPYYSSKKTIAAFKEKGKDPQTDVLPRKGFHPSSLGIRGIFESDAGKGLAFGPLIASNSTTKVQYFISINDEDLRPCTKQDVAQYTPNPEAFMNYTAPVSNGPVEARTQTFFLSKIYMIGNLGESVVKK